jgi:beta-glucosidase
VTGRPPPGFWWGVATAGHQNEGDNTASDTWFAERVRPSAFREPSGRACDGYRRWRDDVDLVAGLGLNAYRFSVEWARVEPAPGEFSASALEHYALLVEHCHERGLAPIVTYNHFTAPHWFAARGGWLNDEAPERFARYCEVVTAAFGDRIAVALTLNEPNLPRLLSWLNLPPFIRDAERAGLEAASVAAGVPRYRLANVVLPEDIGALEDGLAAGHRAGRAAIKSRRPDLPVGLSVAVVDDEVVGDDPTVRDRKRAEVYQRWLHLAAADDLVGVQNYERMRYDATGLVAPPADAPRNQMGSAVEPASLGAAVRYAHQVSGVPVLVTEHGMATADDAVRAAFLAPSLAGLFAAMDDGIPVLGYCHWTLLDNFEWVFGYGHQLGLFSVDRTTLERTAKPSADAYAALVRSYRTG